MKCSGIEIGRASLISLSFVCSRCLISELLAVRQCEKAQNGRDT